MLHDYNTNFKGYANNPVLAQNIYCFFVSCRSLECTSSRFENRQYSNIEKSDIATSPTSNRSLETQVATNRHTQEEVSVNQLVRSNSTNSDTSSSLIQFSPHVASQPVFSEFGQSQTRLNYAEILQDANANNIERSNSLKVNPICCYTSIDLEKTEAFNEVKRKRSEDLSIKCLADLDNSPIIILKS